MVAAQRILPACLFALLTISHATAGTLNLGELVRFKGQETNTLQGLGLVVGLQGTGDSGALPTARALARMMQLMGGPVSVQNTGLLDLREVEASKNVAMVFVTATVPAVGAQSGDQIDVSINAINAKSLAGGTLMLTPLLGPRADNPTVYAVAQGPIEMSDDTPLTTGRVTGGAKMEASVPAVYAKDNRLTLILNKDFASFDTAQRIEDEINNLSSLTMGGPEVATAEDRIARAIDPLHVEVMIPEVYQSSPIQFIWYLIKIPIRLADHDNRVVINEREGVVAIGADVEIAPVLITHRNLRIEAGGLGFVPIAGDQSPDDGAKLKSLAAALNRLDVPTADLIAIIKTLQAKGDLYGEVIYQ